MRQKNADLLRIMPFRRAACQVPAPLASAPLNSETGEKAGRSLFVASASPPELFCPVCARVLPPDASGCPQHGNTLIPKDPLVGKVIRKKYRLDRLLGRGGMGAVYQARHITMERPVAVKILSRHLSQDHALVERFRREALAASRLSHKNCCGVFDYGETEDGTFYIAMEFVSGRTLAEEIRRLGGFPFGRAAHISRQILEALDAAHNAGVIHRDIKPGNIMLEQKPGHADLVRVVDFGIAKITDTSREDQAALTVPGTIFGTPEYMSPEQARGDRLDTRADIYAASAVILHMLLGYSPFRGSTVRATLTNVFTMDPPSPRQTRPEADIPEDFENVLMRGLEKKRMDRWPNAEAFLRALGEYGRGGGMAPSDPWGAEGAQLASASEPTTATPPTSHEKPKRLTVAEPNAATTIEGQSTLLEHGGNAAELSQVDPDTELDDPTESSDEEAPQRLREELARVRPPLGGHSIVPAMDTQAARDAAGLHDGEGAWGEEDESMTARVHSTEMTARATTLSIPPNQEGGRAGPLSIFLALMLAGAGGAGIATLYSPKTTTEAKAAATKPDKPSVDKRASAAALTRGERSLANGDLEGALDEFRAALLADPDNVKARQGQAIWPCAQAGEKAVGQG
jgi:serine/threonine protein kinase